MVTFCKVLAQPGPELVAQGATKDLRYSLVSIGLQVVVQQILGLVGSQKPNSDIKYLLGTASQRRHTCQMMIHFLLL